jgi:hypothetical protein
MTPLKKVISAEKRCYMLCARGARTQHIVPHFFRPPFFQGSQQWVELSLMVTMLALTGPYGSLDNASTCVLISIILHRPGKSKAQLAPRYFKLSSVQLRVSIVPLERNQDHESISRV